MTDFCVVWGPVIAVLVTLLKKIPFIDKIGHKWLAALLSVVSVVLPLLIKSEAIVSQILAVIACVIATFGTAVASYEVTKSTVRLAKDGPLEK